MKLLLKHHAGPREHSVVESSIRNQHGLHPRLACEFVRCAHRFQSTLVIKVGARRFSARNVTELLEANLAAGTVLSIIAEGADAAVAAAALDTFLRHLALLEDPQDPQRRLRALRRDEGAAD